MKPLHQLRLLAGEAFASDARQKLLNSTAFILLLIFAAIAPFPYGGILPAGSMMIELFAFAAAALTFFSNSRPLGLGPARVPVGTVTAVALVGVIQLLPLPQRILESLSNTSTKIYHETTEIVTLFGRNVARQPRISIAPTETASTVLLVLAYLALFVSAARLLHNRSRRRLLLLTLFATAAAQIITSAIGRASEGRIHSAFVNPNHFAAYLEIVLALAFGALWAEILTNRERSRNIADRAERFEKRLWPLAARTLVWGFLAAGIGLTRSRGGIVSATTTTLVLLSMAVLHHGVRRRRRLLATGGISALLAGLIFAAAGTGSGPLLRFLASEPRDIGTDMRLALWRTSLRASQEFPLFGSGLGTFREAFRRVQPRELEGLVEQAHSDSLQLLVTAGWIGVSLGMLGFVSLFFLLARAWRHQKHREESAVILAGFGALLSLTIHGIAESNFSVPAIPATLACALGAAWAAARSRTEAQGGKSFTKT